MAGTQLRILDANYFFDDTAVTTVSSESSYFPATNLAHEFRSKVWRSSGYFEITSTNKYIDFKETGGGPEITATLTEGNYSTTALAAHIKAKMDAATLNSRVYTISYSVTTGKWTIAGSTFLSLLFSSGTNAANSLNTTIGFSITDRTAATSYLGSFVAIHTNEYVNLDIQSTEAVDTIMIFFDPLAGPKFSDDATLYLQGSATLDWTSPAVNQALTIDNQYEVINHFFATDQSYRYWRLKIHDPKNFNLYIEIGKILLGKAVQLSQGPEAGFELTLDDQSNVQKTQYGHTYVDIYPQRRFLKFEYKSLPYVDVQILDAVFQRIGNKQVVGISIDSDEQLFDKDHMSFYGKISNSLVHKNNFLNFFDESIQFEETF